MSQTPDELTSILTDRDGHTHRVSLGPGEMNDRWISDTKERATKFLPPVLAGVVGLTKQMFVQAIFDLAVPRMVFDRVVLLGDAACVVRPHTASGTSKAAGDALALAHALRDVRDNVPRHTCAKADLLAVDGLCWGGVAIDEQLDIPKLSLGDSRRLTVLR
jgi:2-polyprenyl-6-methoxyphenol hydroxylase-like FAD-dependent oxidoreductase